MESQRTRERKMGVGSLLLLRGGEEECRGGWWEVRWAQGERFRAAINKLLLYWVVFGAATELFGDVDAGFRARPKSHGPRNRTLANLTLFVCELLDA